MKHKFSAKRLADVLFESAKSNGSLDSARDSITEFDRILRINNDLKSFVQSKRFSQTEKQAILIDSLGASFNGLVVLFVLFDAIEDAGFSYVNNMHGRGTLRNMKEEAANKQLNNALKNEPKNAQIYKLKALLYEALLEDENSILAWKDCIRYAQDQEIINEANIHLEYLNGF